MAERKYPIDTQLDPFFGGEDAPKMPSDQGEHGIGILFQTIDFPNRFKNAATQDVLQSLTGEGNDPYFGTDIGRTASRIWEDDLMGADVIRESFPEVDVVENSQILSRLQDSGFKVPSFDDVSTVIDAARGFLPGGDPRDIAKIQDLFSEEAAKGEGFFDKRRTPKDIEENAEFLARNVAGFTWDVTTDPLNLLTFGTAGLGKKAAQGLLKAGDALGPLVTKTANQGLTAAGAFKFAEKFNDSFARDLVKQVPHLSDKKALAKALQLGPDLATVQDVAKGLGVETHMKYGNPTAVYDKVSSILNAADGVGMRTADDVLMDSTIRAQKATSAEFATALESLRQNKVQSLKDLAVDRIKDPLYVVPRQKVVRDSLDLGDNVPITALFEPNRLRYGGKEIPLVSDTFDVFLDGAGAALQGTKYALGKSKDLVADIAGTFPLMDRVKDAVSEVKAPWAQAAFDNVTKRIAGLPTAQEVLAPFSRRIAAMPPGQGVFGPGQAANTIREAEAERAFLMAEVAKRGERYFSQYSDDAAMQSDKIQEVLEVKLAAFKQKSPNATPEVMELARQGILKEQQGLYPEGFQLWKAVTDDFKRYGNIEKQEGILINDIDDYYKRSYLLRPGAEDSRASIQRVSPAGQGDRPGFTQQRTFDKQIDAAVSGFQAIKDPRTTWVERTFAHEKELANKKQMFNMVMQYGMDPQARNLVGQLAKDDVTASARASSQIARNLNIKIDPAVARDLPNDLQTMKASGLVQDILEPGETNAITNAFAKVDPVWGLPRLAATGEPFSPELYQSYKTVKQVVDQHGIEILQDGDKVAELGLTPLLKDLADKDGPAASFLNNMVKNEFTFSPTEEQAIGALWKNYQEANDKLLLTGHKGRILGDGAGLGQLPEPLKRQINKLHKGRKIDDETAQMLKGDLPDNMITALKESFEAKNAWKEMAKSFPPDIQKRVEALQDGYGSFMGYAKLLTTRMFPGYWAGNVAGAQMTSLHAIGDVAEALSPYRVMKNAQVFNNGADLVTKFGQRIPNKQLMREMVQYEIKVSARDLAESMNTYDKMFKAAGKALDPRDPTSLIKNEGLVNELNKGVEQIENFARSNLYIGLRRQGMDPSNAASEVNRALIDYKRGKTMVEKNYIAPMFFFYAFSRGEASNTFKSLATQPGRLLPQYRFAMSAAEMAGGDEGRDSGYVDNQRYYDASINRTFGKLPAVGIDERTGNPVGLVSARMPVEDVAQLLPIELPSEMSSNAITNAFTDSLANMGRGLASRMNPAIKGVIEGVTGKDLFTGRDTDDPSLAANKVADLDVLMERLGGNYEDMGKPSVKFQDSALLRSLARNLPPVGRLNTEMQKMAQSQNPQQATMGALLGMRLSTLDPKSPEYKRVRKLKKELKSAGINVESTITRTPRSQARYEARRQARER